MRATTTSSPRDEERPTLLMVGSGDPLDAALRVALDRHGLFVEAVGMDELRRSVHLTAPDMILLVGDAAVGGGEVALGFLTGDAASSAVPVAILAPDARLESRMHAFRHGAMAVVPRSASADAMARHIATLGRELSNRFEEKTGEIGEATFDELVELVKKELRSGILSVHAPAAKGAMRVVLGAGRPVAEAVQEFVARLKPHVTPADPVYYQFHASAGGTVELLEMDNGGGRVEALTRLRVLLVDDDPARADTLAQELRARGAIVFVTDTTGRGLERAIGLDPQVAIIDAAGLEGPGFQVVRAIRRDLRLRWASILVAPWDEIWPRGASMPDLERLAARMEPLLVPERDLAERAKSGESFDVRLESTGPSRMLRVLIESGATLHVTARNPKAVVDVDLAQGLVVGAMGRTPTGETMEGAAALAALLALGSGRVHVERRANPSVANIMCPVDEALAMASSERSAVPASHPPEPPSLGGSKAAALRAAAAAKSRPRAQGSTSTPREAARSGELAWGTQSQEAFVPLEEDDEGTAAETSIKNLAGLARASEVLLTGQSPPRSHPRGEPAETVRPAKMPVDSEAMDPRPPTPAVGGPVAAGERNQPPRRHRSTLLMGAPVLPPATGTVSQAKPPTPPAKPSLPARRLTPATPILSQPAKLPPRRTPAPALPAKPAAASSPLAPTVPAPALDAPARPAPTRPAPARPAPARPAPALAAPLAGPVPTPAAELAEPRAGAWLPPPPSVELEVSTLGSASFEGLLDSASAELSPDPAPNPPLALAPADSAPPDLLPTESASLEVGAEDDRPTEPTSERSPSPLPPPPGATVRVPRIPAPAHHPSNAPTKRGLARRLALVSVALASLVFVVVVGLIGYRYSGAREPRVDQLLALLGAAPGTPSLAATNPVPDPPEPGAAAPPGAIEPSAIEPSAIEPGAIEPSAIEPSAIEPSAIEPSAIEPSAIEPGAIEPIEPGAAEPAAIDSTESAEPHDHTEPSAPVEDPPEVDEPSPVAPPGAPQPAAEAASESSEPGEAAELLSRAQRAPTAEAERLYRRVLELDARNHYAMLGLGQLLMDRGAHDQAAEQFRGAVRRRPRRAPYRVLLGDALAAGGDQSGARREWEQALEIEPTNRLARQRLGQ